MGFLLERSTVLLPLLAAVFTWATLATAAPSAKATGDVYKIGVGIGDVTGPSAEVNLMGYSIITQTVSGIHLRQYSRAFIFGDSDDNRVVIVSVDAGMISQAVTFGVIDKLKELYGGLYTEENVCLSGTHTHSGPAGFFQYLLYDITSLGFINATYDALVTGIVKSVQMAHDSIQDGYIYHTSGDLLGANINRSPYSYEQNPAEERAKYQNNTETKMVLLKLVDLNQNPIGMLNWFSVHGTSMNNSNGYISSDNKGHASVLFEEQFNPAGTFPGQGAFVGAFAQTNEGDSSPNTQGAKCIDTGEPCDYQTSTCNGKNELCIAFGPGKDMFESTKIIAEMQFNKAMELWEEATEGLSGPVKFIHQHVNMSYRSFDYQGETLRTCSAALGFAFAAGTTDGPGAFDFHQATTQGHQNDLWDFVRDFLHTPSQEMLDCHYPKAVLLPTGEMYRPVQWTMEIVPTQLFQIGNLVVIAVPGEFTTMSGRRTRDAVQQTYQDLGADNDNVYVISGLSNIYTNYIATYEEYQVQRYEGASTMYGPNTLKCYISQYQFLASNLIQNNKVDPGPNPPNLMDEQFCLLADVMFETTPPGTTFGSVLVDVNPSYSIGDTVSVSFVCGNPRNNIMLESTYLKVEYQNPTTQEWVTVAVDSQWETRFAWELSNSLLQQSTCHIHWEIPSTATPGNYRIFHQGYHKGGLFTEGVFPYNGYSNVFRVLSTPSVQLNTKNNYYNNYHNVQDEFTAWSFLNIINLF